MAMKEAPALAKEIAVALPRPREAPLMKTVLQDRLALMGSMAG